MQTCIYFCPIFAIVASKHSKNGGILRTGNDFKSSLKFLGIESLIEI